MPWRFLFLMFLSTPVLAQDQLATTNSAPPVASYEKCVINASKLLTEVFDLMKKNYYKKDFIAWDSLQLLAQQQVKASTTCEGAYDAINHCFRLLKEQHSFVMPAIKAATYNNDTSYVCFSQNWKEQVGSCRAELLEPEIGYLEVPAISSTDRWICEKMSDSLQSLIAHLDRSGVKHWIIDLRKNTGGNCWPMLTGIGPLLQTDTCVYFIRNEERVPVIYKNGKTYQGKYERCGTSQPGYQLANKPLQIIVLTGNRTASSGEIVALAFRGMKETTMMGLPTAGLTTANATYQLSNNAMLVLSVCQEADRKGRIQEGRMKPDIIIESKYGEDTALQEALMKLREVKILSNY